MAYVEKYYLEHTSVGGVDYRISIQKEGFSGTPEKLKLLGNGSLQIDYKHDGWFKPIIGQSCSFTILNDASNWYDLEDIATLDEKEFKVVVDASYNGESVTLFSGFINSDVVTQKYLNNSSIQLTASNYVSKLENVHPSIIDTVQKRSIIDVLNETLKMTGKSDDIRVNIRLDPSEFTIPSNRSIFNMCGIDTESFWNNNVDRENGLKIIEALLKPFDSYIYWWDNKWHIQRYADVWINDTSKHWVEYSSDVSYGYGTNATSLYIEETSTNLPISSFSDKAFTGQSQQISMIPGLEYLEINIKNEQYLNLTTGDLSGVTGVDLYPTVMYPSVRTWNAYAAQWNSSHTGWHFPGYYSFGLFDSSPGYSLQDSYQFGGQWIYPGMTYKTISNAIYRSGWPQYYINGVFQYPDYDRNSLCTKFKMTITDESIDPSIGAPTTLNIKFKYASIYPGYGGFQAWDHKLKYFLRVPPGNRWITYDAAGDYWKYSTSSSLKDVSCNVVINGADFAKDTGVAEVNIDIPIGDVSGWTLGDGDFELIFGVLGAENVRKTGTTPWTAYNMFCYYGDFQISANSGLSNNRLTAQINNNVLNKETVDLDFFDISNLNYRNGIFYGSDYSSRTTEWTDANGIEYYSLPYWLIHDRFQLYNRNRRKIEGTMRYRGFLKPFSMWVDTYDPCTRKYLLSEYTYSPGEDAYRCTWLEYDNSEVVNLNIV